MSPDNLPEAHRNQPTGYAAAEVDLPDVVLMNPGGRVVEVPGELAEKLLFENGYRRATETEAAPIAEYRKRTHPEILKRAEIRRVREQRHSVDELEAELAAEDAKAEKKSGPKAEKSEDDASGDFKESEETTKPRSRG